MKFSEKSVHKQWQKQMDWFKQKEEDKSMFKPLKKNRSEESISDGNESDTEIIDTVIRSDDEEVFGAGLVCCLPDFYFFLMV